MTRACVGGSVRREQLRQGATYLDLQAGRAFTATGEMSVEGDELVVPKDGVHYETWNKLVSM